MNTLPVPVWYYWGFCIDLLYCDIYCNSYFTEGQYRTPSNTTQVQAKYSYL
jgi:hypothetical protein